MLVTLGRENTVQSLNNGQRVLVCVWVTSLICLGYVLHICVDTLGKERLFPSFQPFRREAPVSSAQRGGARLRAGWLFPRLDCSDMTARERGLLPGLWALSLRLSSSAFFRIAGLVGDTLLAYEELTVKQVGNQTPDSQEGTTSRTGKFHKREASPRLACWKCIHALNLANTQPSA